jgi:membrane protein YdbS with pleckstrin-like domain
MPADSARDAEADLDPETSGFRSLDPRVRGVWRLATLLRFGVTLSLAGAFLGYLAGGWGLSLGEAVLAGAALPIIFAPLLALVLAPLMYRYWSFRVDQAELRVRHGILWRVDTLVPHGRIQYVEIRRGLLERRSGLSSLVVHTAASEAGQVVVPGLDAPEAESLRRLLISLIDDDRL